MLFALYKFREEQSKVTSYLSLKYTTQRSLTIGLPSPLAEPLPWSVRYPVTCLSSMEFNESYQSHHIL
jgi:hypothetical protein